MGHATRSVPIVSALAQSNRVILGVTKLNRHFFDLHFPDLLKIEIPSYNIAYSKTLPVWIKVMFQWRKITRVIQAEKKQLEDIISRYSIQVVVSDNRFGLNNKKAHSVFITHQLKLKTPFFFGFANRLNKNYIQQFDEVWVPDYKEEHKRLSGELSDPKHIKIPVKFINPQSQLQNIELKRAPEKSDLLLLLSGVEPQRSVLEKILLESLKGFGGKIILVRGTEHGPEINASNATVYNFVSGEKLKNLIVHADTVLCRSGYSTLMDLYLLNKKKLILVATPGQTEQEYLARRWSKIEGVRTVSQSETRNIF